MICPFWTPLRTRAQTPVNRPKTHAVLGHIQVPYLAPWKRGDSGGVHFGCTHAQKGHHDITLKGDIMISLNAHI
jgi:hypothetical protein